MPVLVRGAVLFECALYVNRIRNGWLPPSLEVNYDVYCKKVLMNFKQWGEAVGGKLEELEELEQEKVREEEPVLPKETSKGNSFIYIKSTRVVTLEGALRTVVGWELKFVKWTVASSS